MNVTTSNKRLLALDVMRGITIAGMILVNTPGSWQHAYAFLFFIIIHHKHCRLKFKQIVC